MSYFFPNLASDKGWVNYEHIESLMQFHWDFLGLIEVIEYVTRVFVELLIKLYMFPHIIIKKQQLTSKTFDDALISLSLSE